VGLSASTKARQRQFDVTEVALSEREEVMSMSLGESHHGSDVCMFLESKSLSEDYVDESAFDENYMSEGGGYLCNHTGRVNGPDFRPADPKRCKAGRQCFRMYDHF
jgi:hypothetical protein